MATISFIPVSFTNKTYDGQSWRPANMLLADRTGPRAAYAIADAASTGEDRYTAPEGKHSHILVTTDDSVTLAYGSNPVASSLAAPDGGDIVGYIDLTFGGQMPLLVKPGQKISWMKRPV
ncbi:hypothetical protein ABWI01_03345 [Oceanicaulis alexandrii]|uniref:hypothetical protein n=1 Tax=Oceanicaulis alexandrii TaxID=153233 RepID=UPI0035CFCE73